MNKQGDFIISDGVKYVVGENVFATEASEYDGLFGVITEIRDGEDKDTENDTPDIYCCFEPPVLPYEIERLERRFQDLYERKMMLDEICLDEVIMAPAMLRPLPSLDSLTKTVPIYIVVEDWAEHGEPGHSETAFLEAVYAKKCLDDCLREEKVCGCISRWEGRKDYVSETREGYYELYQDGCYLENHYSIELKTEFLK